MEAAALIKEFELYPTGCDLFRFASSGKVQQLYRGYSTDDRATVEEGYKDRMEEIGTRYKINDLDHVPLRITATTVSTNEEDKSKYITLDAIRKDTDELLTVRTRATAIMRFFRDRTLPSDVVFVRIGDTRVGLHSINPFWMVIPLVALVDKNPFIGANHSG
jgi:hypothetical protein